MITSHDLGALTKIRVSTDGRGVGAGWFLGSVTVQQQPDGVEVLFPCDMWFDTDEGDGQLERDLKPQKVTKAPEGPKLMVAWTVEDVAQFIGAHVDRNLESIFSSEDIDGLALSTISDADLQRLGLVRLQRAKFWKAFAQCPVASVGEEQTGDDGVLDRGLHGVDLAVEPEPEPEIPPEPEIVPQPDPEISPELKPRILEVEHVDEQVEDPGLPKGPTLPPDVLENLTGLFQARYGREPTEDDVRQWSETIAEAEQESGEETSETDGLSQRNERRREGSWLTRLAGACAGGLKRSRVWPTRAPRSTAYAATTPKADSQSVSFSSRTEIENSTAQEAEAEDQLSSSSNEAPSPVAARPAFGLVKEIELMWDGTFHFKVAHDRVLRGLHAKAASAVDAITRDKAAQQMQEERVRIREEAKRAQIAFERCLDSQTSQFTPELLEGVLARGGEVSDTSIVAAMSSLQAATAAVKEDEWIGQKLKGHEVACAAAEEAGRKPAVWNQDQAHEEYLAYAATKSVEERATAGVVTAMADVPAAVSADGFKRWYTGSSSEAVALRQHMLPRKSKASQIIESCSTPLERLSHIVRPPAVSSGG